MIKALSLGLWALPPHRGTADFLTLAMQAAESCPAQLTRLESLDRALPSQNVSLLRITFVRPKDASLGSGRRARRRRRSGVPTCRVTGTVGAQLGEPVWSPCGCRAGWRTLGPVAKSELAQPGWPSFEASEAGARMLTWRPAGHGCKFGIPSPAVSPRLVQDKTRSKGRDALRMLGFSAICAKRRSRPVSEPALHGHGEQVLLHPVPSTSCASQ